MKTSEVETLNELKDEMTGLYAIMDDHITATRDHKIKLILKSIKVLCKGLAILIDVVMRDHNRSES